MYRLHESTQGSNMDCTKSRGSPYTRVDRIPVPSVDAVRSLLLYFRDELTLSTYKIQIRRFIKSRKVVLIQYCPERTKKKRFW